MIHQFKFGSVISCVRLISVFLKMIDWVVGKLMYVVVCKLLIGLSFLFLVLMRIRESNCCMLLKPQEELKSEFKDLL